MDVFRPFSRVLPSLVMLAVLFAPSSRADAPYALDPRLDLGLGAFAFLLRGYSEEVHHASLSRGTDPAGLRRASVPAFDRWSIDAYDLRMDRLSTVLGAAQTVIAGSLSLADVALGNEGFPSLGRDLVLAAETYALASGLPLMAKAWTRRARPLAYNPRAESAERGGADSDASFFSAHTTGAFGVAVFSAYTWQLKHPGEASVPWVWGGMLATAGTVGALRIASGKHFLSDVAVGALVGSACGYGVPRLHLFRPARSRAAEAARAPAVRVEAGLLWAHAADLPATGLLVRF